MRTSKERPRGRGGGASTARMGAHVQGHLRGVKEKGVQPSWKLKPSGAETVRLSNVVF